MRNYWRVKNSAGTLTWIEVDTDANGFNDLVYLSNLTQVLQLEQGESPLYGQFGIAAQQSIIQQVWPDFSVSQTQQQFAPYFANLQISKVQNPNPPEPTYNIFVIAYSGANLNVNLVPSTGVLATPQGQPITIGGLEISV